MPKNLVIERNILRMMLKGLSPKKIIEKLNRNLISMYIEAFQSYVMNLAISRLYLMMYNSFKVRNLCEVIPYPTPLLKPNDFCSKIVLDVFKDELQLEKLNYYVRYLHRGVRETTLSIEKPKVSIANNNLVVEFELKPSSYATVVLREMLREKFMV